MTRMIAHYARLIAFAFGLLIGVQLPGFVDQYAKRVSAHQLEIAHNFAGFQQIADQYFGGDVAALIAHHETSTDPPIHDEARVIRSLYERLQMFNAELAAMRAPLIRQMLHVLFRPNSEILRETRSEYSYTVPLNAAAIISGVLIALVFAALVEALLVACLRLLRPRQIHSLPGHDYR